MRDASGGGSCSSSLLCILEQQQVFAAVEKTAGPEKPPPPRRSADVRPGTVSNGSAYVLSDGTVLNAGHTDLQKDKMTMHFVQQKPGFRPAPRCDRVDSQYPRQSCSRFPDQNSPRRYPVQRRWSAGCAVPRCRSPSQREVEAAGGDRKSAGRKHQPRHGGRHRSARLAVTRSCSPPTARSSSIRLSTHPCPMRCRNLHRCRWSQRRLPCLR